MRKSLPWISPFAVWIILQMVLPVTALAYAVRACLTAFAFVVPLSLCRGSDLFSAVSVATLKKDLSFANLLVGLLVGVAVTALWVYPEVFDFYRRWFVLPIGEIPVPASVSAYDPVVCGWPLTIIKLIGSAFVIAPAEELFFRSFLYRRLQAEDFSSVPHTRFDLSAFCWVVFLFTLEHDRPLAAVIAGVAYGLVYIRGGLVPAVLAHVTTNLLLALHVIHHCAWAFW